MSSRIVSHQLIVTLVFMLFALWSCQEQEPFAPATTDFEVYTANQAETTTSPRLFVDGLSLPVGTKIYSSEEKPESVSFELPANYRALWYDANTGQLSISKSSFGGYSCKCSGSSGSCTVFYTSQTGYGCLQNDCSGSCTGSPKKDDDQEKSTNTLKLAGIITIDALLKVGHPVESAQLLPGFRDAFFDMPSVAKEIRENYEFAYANIKAPDFSAVSFGEIPDGYSLLTTSIHGVEFGMLVPGGEAELLDLFPASVFKSGSSNNKSLEEYSCTSSSSGCQCVGEKKCKFGFCVYTCSGCGVCNLEVEK